LSVFKQNYTPASSNRGVEGGGGAIALPAWTLSGQIWNLSEQIWKYSGKPED